MDWEEACVPEGSQPFAEQFPLSPTPNQAIENQSQMKAFLWGLGAAGALLTKPDPKQRNENATESLNRSVSVLPSSRFKSKWSIVLVQLKAMNEMQRYNADFILELIRQFSGCTPSPRPCGAV